MNILSAYLDSGWNALFKSISLGAALYVVIFFVLLVKRKRRKISTRNVVELVFCIYCITVLSIVGVFSMSYDVQGFANWNLVPFLDGYYVPMVLNALLFVPYGFLLPYVFPRRWTWKRAVVTGAVTSVAIEFVQLFGGRFAEIDDILMNTLGTLIGYVLYICAHGYRANKKKAGLTFVILCIVTGVLFTGLLFICGRDDSAYQPDGLMAVQEHIASVRLYHDGTWLESDEMSNAYSQLEVTLANCGGHILDVQTVSEDDIWNDTDYYIEVSYTQPQTIVFVNAEGFAIEDAAKLLYNADTNILYWGNEQYDRAVDYTVMDELLQEHASEILEGYQDLRDLLAQAFA